MNSALIDYHNLPNLNPNPALWIGGHVAFSKSDAVVSVVRGQIEPILALPCVVCTWVPARWLCFLPECQLTAEVLRFVVRVRDRVDVS